MNTHKLTIEFTAQSATTKKYDPRIILIHMENNSQGFENVIKDIVRFDMNDIAGATNTLRQIETFVSTNPDEKIERVTVVSRLLGDRMETIFTGSALMVENIVAKIERLHDEWILDLRRAQIANAVNFMKLGDALDTLLATAHQAIADRTDNPDRIGEIKLATRVVEDWITNNLDEDD